MNPVQHPSSNDVLAPPRGATPEQCRPLYITRVVFEPSMTPGVVSYWQPSPEELALLNQGRPVWLSCLGNTHAPVMLGVEGAGLF